MTVQNRWMREPHQGTGPRSGGGSLHATVKAKRRDFVCSEFDKATELEQLRETLGKEYAEAGTEDAKLDALLKTVRHLKRLFRCEGSFDEGVQVVSDLAPELEAEVKRSAGTVLGGHLVAVAQWSERVLKVLVDLGARAERLRGHAISAKDWGPGTDYDAAAHRRGSQSNEPHNSAVFRRAHVVACRGHHYTSHLAPGFFSNSGTTKGLDLRYNLHQHSDGFDNVAVMAVSGCSMLCGLAQQVLTACFPRARFLGSRNTMTLDAGDYIWPEFKRRLATDATPLLLDNTQDVEQVTHAWMVSNVFAMRKESERILRDKGVELSEYRIKAKQDQLLFKIGPGYADDGETLQLVDRKLAKLQMPVTSDGNACERKADDRAILVPPKGFVLPSL